MSSQEQEIVVIHNKKVRGAYAKDINGQKYHVDFQGEFCQENQDRLEQFVNQHHIFFNPKISFYQFSIDK